MTVNELLAKYDADNITELSGKLLNAALGTEAMRDVSDLAQSLWTEHHPVEAETRAGGATMPHPLNQVAWLWHRKENTVTPTGEQFDPRWDHPARHDTITAP